jgi:hypothetical protein
VNVVYIAPRRTRASRHVKSNGTIAIREAIARQRPHQDLALQMTAEYHSRHGLLSLLVPFSALLFASSPLCGASATSAIALPAIGSQHTFSGKDSCLPVRSRITSLRAFREGSRGRGSTCNALRLSGGFDKIGADDSSYAELQDLLEDDADGTPAVTLKEQMQRQVSTPSHLIFTARKKASARI